MGKECKDKPLFYNGTYHGTCEQDATKCEECNKLAQENSKEKDYRVDLKSFIVSAKSESEAREKAVRRLEKGLLLPDCQIEDIEEIEEI